MLDRKYIFVTIVFISTILLALLLYFISFHIFYKHKVLKDGHYGYRYLENGDLNNVSLLIEPFVENEDDIWPFTELAFLHFYSPLIWDNMLRRRKYYDGTRKVDIRESIDRWKKKGANPDWFNGSLLIDTHRNGSILFIPGHFGRKLLVDYSQ